MKKHRKAQSAPAFFTSGNDLVADVKSKPRSAPKPDSQKASESPQKTPSGNSSVKKPQGRPPQKRTPKSYSKSRPQSAQNTSTQEEPKLSHPRTPQSKRKNARTEPTQPETASPSSSSEPKRSYRKANYAFIDGQNLNKAIQSQGWSLDYREFRKYLEEKYNVKKAYMFIGLITTNQSLYSALQDFGYHLVFKPTIANKFGEVKGNVDAEMVLYAVTLLNQYNKAVIVSGDGDFYTMVQYLQSKGKLEKLLVPNEQAYSALYDTLDVDASFVTDLRKKLEYTKNNQKK